MSTTLVEELLAAANDTLSTCSCNRGPERDACPIVRRAARLRARAERVRDVPRVLSGELRVPGVTTSAEMFEWLTGPKDQDAKR